MQPVTGGPRSIFTEAQVKAALVASDQHWSYGVELLDASLTLVEDISSDVSACTVSRDCTATATVHGSVDLTISRALAWGKDRIRPYIVLASDSAGVTGCRFNMGVYIPTVPSGDWSSDPSSFQATGQDQLWLLQSYLADSASVDGGDNVLDAVSGLLASYVPDVPVRLDTTAELLDFPAGGKTWPMVSSSNYLRIDPVNDLLSAIGYQGLWVDWDGAFRSGPALQPAARPVEWDLVVGNVKTGIVAADRTTSWDVWGGYNRWVFYMNSVSGQPVEGTSQYTVDNTSTGPASQDAIGVREAQPQGVDAADYDSLVAQGDALTAAAIRGTRTVSLHTSKLPLAWHRDLMTLTDDAMGFSKQLIVGQTWSVALHDTSDESMTFGVA